MPRVRPQGTPDYDESGWLIDAPDYLGSGWVTDYPDDTEDGEGLWLPDGVEDEPEEFGFGFQPQGGHMGLADRLAETPARSCAVCAWLPKLPKGDGEAWEAFVTSFRALRAAGTRIGPKNGPARLYSVAEAEYGTLPFTEVQLAAHMRKCNGPR